MAIGDADDLDPWQTLRWPTVRVVRHRPHKADGTAVEAYWLTDFAHRQAGSRAIYRMAKSRWEIENEGFSDAENRYGLEHICHHHANSLLINRLMIARTMTLERLYRIRYPHRGKHAVLQPVALYRLLRLSLPIPADGS